jgi:hypothetical protein
VATKVSPPRKGVLEKIVLFVLLIGFWFVLYYFSFTSFRSYLLPLVINLALSIAFIIKGYSKWFLLSAFIIYTMYVLVSHTLPASHCGGESKGSKFWTCSCSGITRYRQLGMTSECVGKRNQCYSGNVVCGKDPIKDCRRVQTEIPCPK